MPTVTPTRVEAWASCHDGRCPGYKQQIVAAIETKTEFSYFDLGGDVPGIERSTTMLSFADDSDVACPVCGEPRLIADQVRPIYPNISGRPQDALLHVNDQSERMRDVELQNARRDAMMAQLQARIEQQDRQLAEAAHQRELEQQTRSRAPGRPRKESE